MNFLYLILFNWFKLLKNHFLGILESKYFTDLYFTAKLAFSLVKTDSYFFLLYKIMLMLIILWKLHLFEIRGGGGRGELIVTWLLSQKWVKNVLH